MLLFLVWFLYYIQKNYFGIRVKILYSKPNPIRSSIWWKLLLFLIKPTIILKSLRSFWKCFVRDKQTEKQYFTIYWKYLKSHFNFSKPFFYGKENINLPFQSLSGILYAHVLDLDKSIKSSFNKVFLKRCVLKVSALLLE